MLDHDAALRERIRSNLAAHDVRPIPPGEHRRAAVAIVVAPSEAGTDPVDPMAFSPETLAMIPGDISGLTGKMEFVAGGASFLLCRRASRLGKHGGQWALPGGRVDEGETVEETARRELHEELGLQLGPDAVLGRLDDYATRSGYVITPVVMWSDRDEVQPNPDEVAHVYRIGLHHLLRDDSPRFVDIPESDRPVVQLPLGGDLIHAPTAAVLVQFRWVGLDGLAGRRVHAFEQPVFAWR